MIQRIQTLFLLAAAGLHALLFKLNFYTIKSNENEISYSAWQRVNTTSNDVQINFLHILFELILIGVTLFTIFLFKKRRMQMKYCIYLFLATLISFVFAMYSLFTTTTHEVYTLGLGSYLIAVIAVIYLSSYFFIKKDDNLVKSADRLR